MKKIYPVIITPTGENDYFVEVPDMDIATQGSSIENSIDMARDAISIMAVDMEEDGKPLPAASDISNVKPTADNSIVTLVDVDIEAYKRMLDNRAVRKNCTIPGWLNEAAEAQHINISAVLQSALIEKLGINASRRN